jgi:hypothetical protein
VDRDDPTALAHLIECDDPTATRINLVDNKAADEGGYDEEALAALLAALDDDVVGTGYSVSDAELFTALPPGPGSPVEPGAEPLPPAEFPAYDEDIETAYTCPKCSYSWSGKPQ